MFCDGIPVALKYTSVSLPVGMPVVSVVLPIIRILRHALFFAAALSNRSNIVAGERGKLQYLLQNCSYGGRGIVEDTFYERRRAESCVDLSVHHALVNTGEREIVWKEGEKEGSA